jgi:hypothetical protein
MNTEELYAELKGDIAAIANPLFDFSEQCLQKRDNALISSALIIAVNSSLRISLERKP